MFGTGVVENFGNHGPLGAKLHDTAEELEVFLQGPFITIDGWIKMVEPFFPTFLWSSEKSFTRLFEKLIRNLTPLIGEALGSNDLGEQADLIFAPFFL